MLATLRMLAATASRRTERLALESLRLRRFARAVLGERNAGPGPGACVPAASPEAWDLFLLAERCALPLQTRLRESGLLDAMPAASRAVLDRARGEEVQRVLAARAQIPALEGIAADLGTSAVLLKGGIAVGTGDPLDLNDLDLLLPPDHAPAFAAVLDRHGFNAVGTGSSHHLPGRRAPGRLTVEVHRGMKAVDPELVRECWTRVRPIGSAPGLLRLAPPDHLWSLLVHVAVQHPYRVGLLRDWMLIRSAAVECSSAEMEVVRRRIRSNPHAALIQRVLEDATAVGPVDPDPFAGRAGVRYVTAGATFFNGARAPRPRVWRPLMAVSISLATTPTTYFEEWRKVLAPMLPPGTSEEGERPLRRPGLARVLARALRLLVLTFAALLLRRSARRAASRGSGEPASC